VTLVVTGREGSIAVPDAVLVGIAVRAAEQVEGIRVRRRRAIDLDEGVVRLTVAAGRGEPLVELAARAQEQVASALKQMCRLDVTVEVAIGELL
jgi:uncharacterized alkaline shock family protein YloU